jgi:aspartate 1-decarboxylase
MLIEKLKSKIHRATVTDANLNYIGSITVDSNLLRESGLQEYEKVQVVNINNGARFETYTIIGKAGSGEICLNGACARLAEVGDKIIIMSFGLMSQDEAAAFEPQAIFMNDANQIVDKNDAK